LPSIEAVAPGGVVVIAQTLAFFSAMRGAFRRIASGVASSVTEAMESAEIMVAIGLTGREITAPEVGWMLSCVAAAGTGVELAETGLSNGINHEDTKLIEGEECGEGGI